MAKANILIVEDESIIASVIVNALKKFNYNVAANLSSGEEAVRAAIELKPDLILMDIRLTGAMDGITAVEYIQQQVDIPVIYLTAYADELTLERSKKTRPYGYIPKPFQEIELKTIIEIALHKHKFEAALKESETRYRSLFENSLDMIYIADADNRFLEVNPAGLKLFGLTRQEMLAVPIEELYQNPVERAALLSALKKNKFIVDFDLKLKKKDGSLMQCLETAHLLTDENGRIIGSQGIIRDVSEKKKREETLNMLQTAINSSSEAMIITDCGGSILYVNPAFSSISGYSAAEVLGQNPRLLSSGYQTKNFYREMWEVILSGKSWQGEFINKKKNGAFYNQRSSISPVFNDEDKITHFVGISTDISKEKKLEEQLFQAVKLDSLGRLAGGIAHDFNNLLTIINGYAEMVLVDVQDEKIKENVQSIYSAGKKAARLTSHIMAFSRKQIINPQILNVNDVVQDLQKMIRPILGENITLKIKLAAELAPILIDISQLEQVIMNIAFNARDAMPSGGKLLVESGNFFMDDDFVGRNLGAKKGDYVRIEISDTGLGMSAEIQTHVFEPFFTTKKLGEGTGLGLSTVYGIVKQNSGYIAIFSEPGKGSRFSIYFPKYYDAESKAAADKTAEKK
jgi:PAS domain S-box-containing protein